MSQSKKRIRDVGPYMINEKQLGQYNDQVTAIVMDNLMSRENRKLVVKPIRSANPEIWIGSNTVAVFRIKRPNVQENNVVLIGSGETGIAGVSLLLASDPEQAMVVQMQPSKPQDTPVNVTGLLINHINSMRMKKNLIYRDPGVPQADGEETPVVTEELSGEPAENAGSGEAAE